MQTRGLERESGQPSRVGVPRVSGIESPHWLDLYLGQRVALTVLTLVYLLILPVHNFL